MRAKSISEISRRVSSGLTPLRSNQRFWKNGTISWLKTEQLGEKFIYETTEKISEAALNETGIRVFPSDTISIAMYGEGATRGNVSIIKRPMATNQACCNIVLDQELADTEYVYYFLKTQYDALRSLSSGVRKNLSSNDIKNFVVWLPERVDEQVKIASALSALDSKIELNNRINAELEALAKAIYDYWFVQFDFPDANGRPYKSSGGRMVWNEALKREIPTGWEAGVLSDIANITMGQSPAGESYNEEGHGVVFFQGSTDFGARSPDVRMYTTAPGRMAREGDILVSVRAPVGTLNIADRDCCIGRGLAALNSKINNDAYLYRVMTDFKQIFDRKSSEGTTFGSITKDDLFGLKVLIPDERTLQAYTRVATDWLRSAALRDKQNRELTHLRDWLLPLLMNGQVRVA